MCSAFPCSHLPNTRMCATSSADRQTWLTLCAAQAAATGPNQTSPTWQPFKCPVCSSSAWHFALHIPLTNGPLQMQTAKLGPVIFPHFVVPLCAICAEQQKSQETAASSRRCAEKGGGLCAPSSLESTAKRRGDTIPSLLQETVTHSGVLSFFTALAVIIIPVRARHHRDTTRCVNVMGATATEHHTRK